MSVVSDYIVEFGLDSIKDNIKGTIEKEKVKKEFEEFLKREKKLNEFATIDEEIDFEGLRIYTKENLLEDMRTYLVGDKKEREFVRRCMIDNAVKHSNAKTETSKKRIYNFMSEVIKLLKKFFRKQCSVNNLILKDDITEELEECTQRIIDKTSNNGLSIENGMKLVESGRINEVEANLNDYKDAIGTKHQLYPNYCYGIRKKDSKLEFISEPQSLEAIKKYPPNIKCRGNIKVGDAYISELSEETIRYADRHQLPIIFNVKEATKFLGDIQDPVQHEADDIVGKDFVRQPKKFPGPFPYSIIIDEKVVLEYCLLQIKEIGEDSTFTVCNVEPEGLKICIKINLINKLSKFNITIKGNSNKDLLKFVQFLKVASYGKKIVFKDLLKGVNLLEGSLNDFIYNSPFEDIDKEIDFIKRIILIEEHFNKKIIIPEKIYVEDYNNVCYISDLLSKEGYNGHWTGTSLQVSINNNSKMILEKLNKESINISALVNEEILLFGHKYNLEIYRTCENAKIKDYQKVMTKIKILEDGDICKITFIPKNEKSSSYIDVLNNK